MTNLINTKSVSSVKDLVERTKDKLRLRGSAHRVARNHWDADCIKTLKTKQVKNVPVQ